MISLETGSDEIEGSRAVASSDAPPRPESDRAASDTQPVFLQDWWQREACGRHPHSLIEIERSGATAGWLSFVTHRNKIGGRIGHEPFWTHLGGPVLREGLAVDEQRGVIADIVGRLPRRVSFRFMCDPNASWAPCLREEMQAAGFRWERYPTYLHHPDDVGILERMNRKHRTQIKAAMKRLTVVDGTPDEFIAFYRANLEAGSHSPFAVAHALLSEGLKRGQVRIALALNAREGAGQDRIDAAIAYAWDDRRCYYWLSRRRIDRPDAPRPELADRDATKVLVLAAIEHASRLGLVFDADCPETVGGRWLFEAKFGFTRIEYRDVYVRRTAATALYERTMPALKRVIKTIYPNAPLNMPDLDGAR